MTCAGSMRRLAPSWDGKRMYESLGFRDTGERSDAEVVRRVSL
jgi:hypothetical protein